MSYEQTQIYLIFLILSPFLIGMGISLIFNTINYTYWSFSTFILIMITFLSIWTIAKNGYRWV